MSGALISQSNVFGVASKSLPGRRSTGRVFRGLIGVLRCEI